MYYAQNYDNDSVVNKLFETPSGFSIEKILEYTRTLPDTANTRKYEILSRALEVCDNIRQYHLKGDIFLERGVILYRLRKFRDAIDNYSVALDIYREIPDSIKIRLVFEELGYVYARTGQQDSSAYYYQKDFELSEKFCNDSTKSVSLTNMGHAAWRVGNFTKALENFQLALKIREDNGLKELVSASLNSIGSVYWKRGNYGKALESFIRSMKIRKQLNDSLGLTISSNNIGLVLKKLMYFEKADEYFQTALKLSLENNYNFGECYSYYNLGLLAKKKTEMNNAIDYLQKSLEISKKNSFLNLKMMTEIFLGECYEYLSKYDTALEYYKIADKQSVKYADSFVEAKAKSKLASLFYKLDKQKNRVLPLLRKSNKIAEKENLREILSENYLVYYNISMDENNYIAALKNYKLSHSIEDEILNENLMNNLTSMVVRYEIESTESENKILKKESVQQQLVIEGQRNVNNLIMAIAILAIILVIVLIFYYIHIIKKSDQLAAQKKEVDELNKRLQGRNNELNISNETKDKLFSIISHDLRNPVGVVQNYCQFLNSELKSLSSEEIEDISNAMLKSTNSIMDLIFNLLDWSRSQLGRMNIKNEVFPVSTLFYNSLSIYSNYAQMKSITLSHNLKHEIFIYGDMNMVDSIMRNLVNNAIKFTNADGNIILDAKIKGTDCVISVIDDGIGMKEEVRKTLFVANEQISGTGTAKETGTGLGLMLCKEFVKQNNGNIGVESEQGKGSRFWFTVPLGNTDTNKPL